MKIAWIGTGVMGAPMATHLANANYEVIAYNRTYEKAKKLEPTLKATQSIKVAVENADIIFTIVGYPKDVKEIYTEIFKFAKPKSILVDMTTSSPSLAKEIYQKAKALNLYALDAPVTGGDLGAINQTLSIMVGGDEDIYKQVLPLFKEMGKTINYMGEAGNGQYAKLANQASIAGSIAGCAEALAFAKSKELDLDVMLDVIVGGSANSWQAANNGPKMIKNDASPGFYIKHFLKDLNLILDEKDDLKLNIVENVAQIYTILVEEGYDDFGTQAIFDYYLNQLK
ncbi:MAG: NAD(P)-dependent oxidoreductase [Erysipelothrix sp.]|nr:NAD(P)-dependent oxidoreductase [Erysipelothrix sp.]